MDVFRYKPLTGPKISAGQRTMMTIFPKNEKKKKKTFSHDCVSREQTTFFILWFLFVRLVRSSYCVVFNILTHQKRDLTKKQSLTSQNVRKRSQIDFEFFHPSGPRDLQPEILHQGRVVQSWVKITQG